MEPYERRQKELMIQDLLRAQCTENHILGWTSMMIKFYVI